MRFWRTSAVVLIALAGARVAPVHAGTTIDSAARRACETALRSGVRADHPASGRVEVLSSNGHRQGSDKQITIRGTGQVATRDSGWRRLTFTCMYNVRDSAVSSLRYDIASASSRPRGQPATPASVCKRAVAKRIHDAHPASGKIRWLVRSIAERPTTNHQTAVTGSGRIQTRDGDWRKFTFSCNYDDRSGRTTRAGARF